MGETQKRWHDAVMESFDSAGTDMLFIGTARVHVVRSKADINSYHTVLEFPNGDIICPPPPGCRGFRYRDECRHVKRVREA